MIMPVFSIIAMCGAGKTVYEIKRRKAPIVEKPPRPAPFGEPGCYLLFVEADGVAEFHVRDIVVMHPAVDGFFADFEDLGEFLDGEERIHGLLLYTI